MAVTREEVEQLKRSWKSDPIWDLDETEGFEEYREELKAFQEECQAEWEQARLEKEATVDQEADRLGVRGLYRLVLQQMETIERQRKAIECLTEGNYRQAYRALQGWVE